MGKFTPGPWKAEQACDKEGGPKPEWWISARGFIDIAETSGEKKPEEEAANARLIAAAPEMYKALLVASAVLSGLVQKEKLYPDQKGYVCGGYAALQQVLAALAKAREEEAGSDD